MTDRVLLVSPANSYRCAAYIQAARQLGIEILVASEGAHSLVSEIAAGLHIDLHKPGARQVLLEAARRKPFQGVVASDDAVVTLASEVAEALDLPHNPPDAALLSRRKDLARARLQAAGVPVPEHRILDLTRTLAEQIVAAPFPAVVKPLVLSGSRGVMRVNSPAELETACGRLHAMLRTETHLPAEEANRALLESFIEGPEIAVEGLLRKGELEVLAVFDKPDPMLGPFFEETYYITPSRHDTSLQALATRRVQEACTAYGLREGPVHAELRFADGQAWIMEVAARTIGGECARLLRMGTGCSLEALVLAHAVGKPLAWTPLTDAAGVLMLPTPAAGVLRRVEGVLDAQRLPYIEELVLSVREGYELVPLPEGSRYLGFAFARGPSAALVERALRQAHAKLRIVVAPLLRIAGGA